MPRRAAKARCIRFIIAVRKRPNLRHRILANTKIDLWGFLFFLKIDKRKFLRFVIFGKKKLIKFKDKLLKTIGKFIYTKVSRWLKYTILQMMLIALFRSTTILNTT